MKELQTIVAEAERARASGKAIALATVVGIKGSAYRLPGARMLIADGEWIAGSISGGCLEDDVVLRATEAIKQDAALVTTYDTTSDDDIVFGVGLGCKGVITILIEPIRPNGVGLDFLEFAKACLENRASGAVATLIQVEGQVNARIGSRMLARAGALATNIDDGELKAKLTRVIEQPVPPGTSLMPSGTSLMPPGSSTPPPGSSMMPSGSSLMPSGRSLMPSDSSPMAPGTSQIALAHGSVGVFVERIEPPTPLVLFGAGHDAMPVVRLAKELGWHVTVVDHRPAYATPARFPLADRLLVAAPEDVPAQLSLAEETLALVMTHNYLRDLKLLELLLPSPLRYVGQLGPRKRTEQLLADLGQRGIHPEPEQLNRLYAPVGLDIGSESPSEVALSMLAEMQAVITGRDGGFIRARKSHIHSRNGPPVL